MAYILREYRCVECGYTKESLVPLESCPKKFYDESGQWYAYCGEQMEPVIGKPASYKHSSWESWRRR